MFTAMLVKKLSPKFTVLFRALLYAIFALIILCLLVDRGVSFYVRDKIFTNIDELPFRPCALVLGTSKYTVSGKPNVYYDSRLMAAKSLIEQQKVNYLDPSCWGLLHKPSMIQGIDDAMHDLQKRNQVRDDEYIRNGSDQIIQLCVKTIVYDEKQPKENIKKTTK